MENVGSNPPLSRYEYSSSTSSRGRLRRLFIFFIILIVIVGSIVFAMTKFFGGEETPTPIENLITETPTPEATPTEEPQNTPTPTPKPTANPIDETTGLDRSKLSVLIQNGSGEAGAASKMAEVLRSFGYNVAKIGNADATDYEKVSIEVKSDKSSFLTLLKKDIAVTYSVGSTSAVLSATASADAIVIVGKQ